MWLLHFLPDWIVHAVLFASVVGLIAAFALKFIPFVGRYSLPILVISFGLLIVSVWFEGALSNEAEWQAKVKEAQAKAAIAEEKAKAASAQIQYKFTEKVKVVKDVQVVVQERIKEVASKMDQDCIIAPEAIDILNSAADNVIPGENK